MKTFAHFDSRGAIHSLVVIDDSEGVAGGVTPEAGMLVDEIQDVKLKADNLDIDLATDIAERYEVVQPKGARQLKEKP